MATAAPQPSLPMLYNQLVPLSSQEHANWRVRHLNSLQLIANVHAIPITIDEFPVAQRYFPIIFSTDAEPVPLALMGLNEGVNVFLNEDGTWPQNVYLPAFVRRYPFLLARLREDSDELSLCVDPSSNLIGPFDEGVPVFENGEPSEQIKTTLAFCEQFEIAAQRTQGFCKELAETGLLEDGEVTIEHVKASQPYTYRGFRMINEQKLRELRGDQVRKMNQNGMLTMLTAHLFSLSLTTEIFGRQLEQGKVPPPQPQG